jgi:hypothetical protein
LAEGVEVLAEGVEVLAEGVEEDVMGDEVLAAGRGFSSMDVA